MNKLVERIWQNRNLFKIETEFNAEVNVEDDVETEDITLKNPFIGSQGHEREAGAGTEGTITKYGANKVGTNAETTTADNANVAGVGIEATMAGADAENIESLISLD